MKSIKDNGRNSKSIGKKRRHGLDDNSGMSLKKSIKHKNSKS